MFNVSSSNDGILHEIREVYRNCCRIHRNEVQDNSEYGVDKRMKDELDQQVEDLGFCLWGVCDPGAFEKHAPVPRIPGSNEFRPGPLDLWPACQSVVVVALKAGEEVLDALVENQHFRAIFYHEIIGHRLGKLVCWFQGNGYAARTAPAISHKLAAVLAGLGKVGRNSLVAHQYHGSNIRFGVVLTDAPLPLDEPNDPLDPAECGSCRRCERVCPEDALADFQLDFSKCLAAASAGANDSRALRAHYIQGRGNYTVECNLCQKVCPLGS